MTKIERIQAGDLLKLIDPIKFFVNKMNNVLLEYFTDQKIFEIATFRN